MTKAIDLTDSPLHREVEEQNQKVNRLKMLLKNVVVTEDCYNAQGNDDDTMINSHIALYALLELAVEVASLTDTLNNGLFIGAANEVDNMFSRMPEIFLNY